MMLPSTERPEEGGALSTLREGIPFPFTLADLTEEDMAFVVTP